jgi:hypothetical protein
LVVFLCFYLFRIFGLFWKIYSEFFWRKVQNFLGMFLTFLFFLGFLDFYSDFFIV